MSCLIKEVTGAIIAHPGGKFKEYSKKPPFSQKKIPLPEHFRAGGEIHFFGRYQESRAAPQYSQQPFTSGKVVAPQ